MSSSLQKIFPSSLEQKILKTDLWDEAKNTRILMWAAHQGAKVFGIDISIRILKDAEKTFAGKKLEKGFILSDLRNIGFKNESFDYIYSMGTIEHFPEFRQAIAECYRVLKKGGVAVIGVPNKFDPFLRPLFISFLSAFHLYAYGEEKAFGMKALEEMLKETGFQILGRSGILFMPGWLRMADLFLYVRWPKSKYFMAPLISFFSFLYSKFPLLRRQGYLIACAVQKP
ncbi:MAG: class I SAM-dependent methyltransferase [Candidatus Aminicenantales bacterium]